jgi:hypothetical protein
MASNFSLRTLTNPSWAASALRSGVYRSPDESSSVILLRIPVACAFILIFYAP